ncbi:hypothetical protein [Methanobrevibacter curvatus]
MNGVAILVLVEHSVQYNLKLYFDEDFEVAILVLVEHSVQLRKKE